MIFKSKKITLFGIIILIFCSLLINLLEIIGNEQNIKMIIPNKVIFFDLKIVPKIIKKIIKNNGLAIKGKILCR